MPLFKINGKNLVSVELKNFALEKELQRLVEYNLETIFNCHLIASEFSTGSVHSGRIDTLGLSEDNNPVIIEYKKVESSELLNQSLYYVSWIDDHRDDFEIAVQKELGNNIKIDWSDIRVICMAPNYKKYDLHAVQVMGTNIELWTYRLFKDGSLYFEEIQQNLIHLALLQTQKVKIQSWWKLAKRLLEPEQQPLTVLKSISVANQKKL